MARLSQAWLALLLSYVHADCGAIASLPKKDSCPPNHLCVHMTGFYPDSNRDQTENPAEDVARCFDNVVFDGMHISVTILDVTGVAIDNYFSSLTGKEKLVVHIGLNAFRTYMKVEKVGTNLYSFQKSKPVAIDDSKQQSHTLRSRFDADALAKNLQAKGYQVKPSIFAGTYYCNYILYQSLRTSVDKSVSMVHVTLFKDNSLETQAKLVKDWLTDLSGIVGPPSTSSPSPPVSVRVKDSKDRSSHMTLAVAGLVVILLILAVGACVIMRRSPAPEIRVKQTSSRKQASPHQASQREASQHPPSMRQASQREASQHPGQASQREASQNPRQASQLQASQHPPSRIQASQRQASQHPSSRIQASQRQASQHPPSRIQASQREASQHPPSRRQASQRQASQHPPSRIQASQRQASQHPPSRRRGVSSGQTYH